GIGLGAGEADGGEHQVEQAAGGADEGLAALVLLAPRRLAHDHHAGGRVAVGKDGVAGAVPELAVGVGGDGGRKRREVGRGGGRRLGDRDGVGPGVLRRSRGGGGWPDGRRRRRL